MSGPGEAEFGVAVATYVRLQTLLARIVSLVLAFSSHLTAVPLGAGWLILLLRFVLLLLLLPLPVWLGDSLYKSWRRQKTSQGCQDPSQKRYEHCNFWLSARQRCSSRFYWSKWLSAEEGGAGAGAGQEAPDLTWMI